MAETSHQTVERAGSSFIEDETSRLAQLLGTISMTSTPSRGITDSPRGTPPTMDSVKRNIQTNSEKIKCMMTDIAHASHHIDHLVRAAESGNLSRGLTVAPKIMLMYADRTTEEEWHEQTKKNTLGYV